MRIICRPHPVTGRVTGMCVRNVLPALSRCMYCMADYGLRVPLCDTQQTIAYDSNDLFVMAMFCLCAHFSNERLPFEDF